MQSCLFLSLLLFCKLEWILSAVLRREKVKLFKLTYKKTIIYNIDNIYTIKIIQRKQNHREKL